MPILNAQVHAQTVQHNGAAVALTPQNLLQSGGPLVQVTIGIAQVMAAQIVQNGGTLPTPVAGLALIDTGAMRTCIDDATAKKMGLPVINTTKMTSATHVDTDQNVYPANITIAGLIQLDAPEAIGANLASQGIMVLLGRDLLQHCIFIYNGSTGTFSLAL